MSTAATRPSVWVHVRPTLARYPGRHYLAVLALSALESVPVLASGAVVAAALDRGFLAGDPATGVALLAGYGALVVAGAFTATLSMPRMARVVEDLRVDLTRSVVGAAVRDADRDGGALDARTVDRVTNQTDGVRTTLAHLLATARTLVFSVLFVVVGLVVVAPPVAAATAVSLALVALALVRISAVWRRRFETSLVAAEEVVHTTSSTFGALRDVIAYGAGSRAARDIGALVDEQNATTVAVGRISALRVAVIGVGGRLPLVGLVAAAPWLVGSGTMSAGELVGAAFYLLNGLEPQLRAIVGMVSGLAPQCAVLLRRLVEFGAATPAGPASRTGPGTGSSTGPSTTADDRPRGARVELRRVRFAYGQHAEPALDGVDLDVAAGTHLAVVGPSGSGKSTLADVAAGLTRPDTGCVLVDGAAVRDVPRAQLASTVTLVPQEAYVFSGTVRENLAYLQPDVGDAELDDAVQRTGCAELVDRLGGYAATLASPAELSEGERQRITLARAFVSRSPVIILDEATCHLHPQAESAVEREFAATGRTLIVIAHRMSSALRADRVAVLDDGRLIDGTHDHLIRSSARYADLVDHWNRR